MESDTQRIFESDLFYIAAAILVALVLQFLARHIIRHFLRKAITRQKGETRLDELKREDTVIAIVVTTIVALIWIVAVLYIFATLGFNITAILTGAGVIGVIVGLSVQNTVKDFLAGFFILTEKQFRVGDTISLMGGSTGAYGATGVVEEITLRITKLRDDGGKLITVRNGEPTVVTNKTYSYATTVFDLTVTYESDIDKLEKIINRLGKAIMKEPEWKDVITSPIRFLRVENFTNDGVVIRAIGTVSPASQWEVGGEYRRRLLAAISKEPKVSLAHSV
jgi:small-conductance mechanosensitive channel